MENAGLETAISWLENEHSIIMGHEKKALQLMKNGDIEGYRKEMKEKAEAVSKLARQAQPVMQNLPEKQRKLISETLEGFSSSASLSLQLDSVFYWSVLLYPMEFTENEPDNLKKFIEELKHS